ncbi:type II toxin-antitoxin system VapC family toxin [Acidisoma cellulosilytica]|uniref:Type II toxin-antitoxin system VapC family toxin n=1 Tax=Acidisoma cellulosilyticum TaxID=2802395 RepID=A0A963Z5L5_9PROT|nr:type II toxin-antitoxin system VapC family toxin [Acidisoma cellulosilyticum]MCB8883063.1 type II toxin-antitoxin system VapC family toxin [Acidisoma cellulosilyticum]
MILVDSSVWIDHLSLNDPALSELLGRRQVLAHPFVIGELSLGNLRQREAVLGALRGLPRSLAATDEEVQAFVDRHMLFGIGIGYVDAHLLAGTSLNAGALLWTRDKRLRIAASRLGLDANIDH